MEALQEQNRRKYPRFADRSLAGTHVRLEPCAPLYGETVSGYLVDLSAGGMSVLASDLIPKKVMLKMKMTLPDGFEIESVITVRHIAKQKDHKDFLHGIEFLNPSPEMIERIGVMADEILACNERTQKFASQICVSSCKLNDICKRPQRVARNVQPILLELTEGLPQPSDSDDSVLTYAPIQRPSMDEIEDFFRKAA